MARFLARSGWIRLKWSAPGSADSGSRRNTSRRERNRSSVLSVAGSGRWQALVRAGMPRRQGRCASLRTGLRPVLDPRDPAALGQGVAGRAMALPASSARRLMSRGVVPDQRGEPTRRTGGRSHRWVCSSGGVFGAGR